MLLAFIFKQPVYGVLLATKLIQILLFIALGIGLMSSLTNAIAHFYLSRDLEFQFSLPVNLNSWLLHRFFQVYIQSNWMLLLFGGPFIWIFLDLSDNNMLVCLLGVGVLAALSAFPVLFSTLLCMSLVKVFPARRVHQVFLVATVIMVASLVFLFRYLEPEQFIGPGGMDRFRGYIDLVSLDSQQWNPAIWASNLLAALSQKQWTEALRHGGQLGGAFVGTVGFMLLAGRRLYRSSWDRALQSLSGEGEIQLDIAKDSFLSRGLQYPRWSQEAREVLLFLRDPSQWSQVFVLLALLGLYLFSVTKLPQNPFGGTMYNLALGNSGFVAFISLSLASRFVFTSFSSDGQAIWLMKTTPDGWVHFVRGKLLVYGVPTLIFALVLNLLSGMLMKLTGEQLLYLGIGVVWDTAFMVFLALGLGMLFINPGIDNPLKMIVSTGGFLLMAVGLFVTLLHVILRLTSNSPEINLLLSYMTWWPDLQDGKVYYYFGSLFLIEVLGLVWLCRQGLTHLRIGDF